MLQILDTSFLVGSPADAQQVLRELDGRRKILVDDGPCREEVLKHSQTDEAEKYRQRIGYTLPKRGRIGKVTYRLLQARLSKAKYCIVINGHDGVVHGQLRAELLELVAQERIEDWWNKDSMWVSLAQRARSPTVIHSRDNGFAEVATVLGLHGISTNLP